MDPAASWIAEHPFATLALAMLTGVLLTAAMWRVLTHLRMPLWLRLSRRVDPWLAWAPAGWRQRLVRAADLDAEHLLLDLLFGFLLVLLALAVFFELADGTGLDRAVGRFDRHLAAALAAQAPAGALRTFSWITHLADREVQTGVCVAVAAGLAWQRRGLLCLTWIAAIAGNGVLTRLLKLAYGRERPLHEHGWALEQGFSFPSGHASGAMVVYGMLAYLLTRALPAAWKLPMALSSVALILCVGYSRVVLHVHYLSDVLAGFLVGSAWLIVCIGTARLIRTRSRV